MQGSRKPCTGREEPAGDVRPTLRGNRFPHADVKK